MGIFAIEIFLLDLSFNRSGVIDAAEIVSVVSMTPLKSFPAEIGQKKLCS
jgi:hypothetical protein